MHLQFEKYKKQVNKVFSKALSLKDDQIRFQYAY